MDTERHTVGCVRVRVRFFIFSQNGWFCARPHASGCKIVVYGKIANKKTRAATDAGARGGAAPAPVSLRVTLTAHATIATPATNARRTSAF